MQLPDERPPRPIPAAQGFVCSKCGLAIRRDAISCKHCGVAFVGPTGRPLKERKGVSLKTIGLMFVGVSIFVCGALAAVGGGGGSSAAVATEEPTPVAMPLPAETIEPTAAPVSTARPVPTAAPTARPAPTQAPPTVVVPTNTPAAPAEDVGLSGGLGLSRGTWETQQGAGTELDDGIGTVEYQGNVLVTFSQEDNVNGIEVRWKPTIGLEDARAIMAQYLPRDAERVESYKPFPDEEYQADVYTSAWLRERFGDVMIRDAAFSPWMESEPGTFMVLYRIHDGQLSSAFWALGNNP